VYTLWTVCGHSQKWERSDRFFDDAFGDYAAHIQNIVRPIGLETIPESHLRPLTTIDDAEKKRVFDDV
jgi:hypothetical protein